MQNKQQHGRQCMYPFYRQKELLHPKKYTPQRKEPQNTAQNTLQSAADIRADMQAKWPHQVAPYYHHPLLSDLVQWQAAVQQLPKKPLNK
jgi:hypothetical protein